MSLIHNEQTKLTATALNNIAVAFIIAGFVAPVVGLGQRLDAPGDVLSIVLSVIWLGTGSILHLCARLVLRRLKP
jgi:hypothetical protein